MVQSAAEWDRTCYLSPVAHCFCLKGVGTRGTLPPDVAVSLCISPIAHREPREALYPFCLFLPKVSCSRMMLSFNFPSLSGFPITQLVLRPERITGKSQFLSLHVFRINLIPILEAEWSQGTGVHEEKSVGASGESPSSCPPQVLRTSDGSLPSLVARASQGRSESSHRRTEALSGLDLSARPHLLAPQSGSEPTPYTVSLRTESCGPVPAVTPVG